MMSERNTIGLTEAQQTALVADLARLESANAELRDAVKELQRSNEALRDAAENESRRADQQKDRADGLQGKTVEYARRIALLMTDFAASHDGLKAMVLGFGTRMLRVEAEMDRVAQMVQTLYSEYELAGGGASTSNAGESVAQAGSTDREGAGSVPPSASPAHTTGDIQ